MMKKESDNQTVQMQGHFLTAQRRLLLELIRDSEGHLDAKELYQRARARDKSIGPATVYRNLNLFKQLGLIDERRLGKVCCYYEIKKSSEHHHLVCQKCGKIIEFQNPYFQQLIETVQREQGFKVTKAELCLEGYCEHCEQEKEREDKN
jgi:Fur family ferric uptake transcriptional regulator